MNSNFTGSTILSTGSGHTSRDFDSISVDTRLTRLSSLTNKTAATTTIDFTWLNSVTGAKLSLTRNENDPPGVFHPNFCLSNGDNLLLVYDEGDEEAETGLVPKEDSAPPPPIPLKEKVFSVNTREGRVLFVVRRKIDQKSFEILSPARDAVLLKFTIPNLRCQNVSIASKGELCEEIYHAILSNRSNITIKRPSFFGKKMGKITGLGSDVESTDLMLEYKCSLNFTTNLDSAAGGGISHKEKFIMLAFFICLGINFKSETKAMIFFYQCCSTIWLLLNLVLFNLLGWWGVSSDMPLIEFGLYFVGMLVIYFTISNWLYWLQS